MWRIENFLIAIGLGVRPELELGVRVSIRVRVRVRVRVLGEITITEILTANISAISQLILKSKPSAKS